jgi:DNA-directed RNA polymerase specialized sigma24 family protein
MERRLQANSINSRSRQFHCGQRFHSANGLDTQGKAEVLFLQACPIARRTTQVRAAAAVASGAILPFDREDIEQEGLIACWRALPHFDPGRASLRTFVEHVVTTRFCSIVRSARRRPVSEPLNLDTVDPEIGWRELHFDVDRLVNLLSGRDRRLALLLMEHKPAEASRMLRVSRSTVYEGIRRIRIVFLQAGFTAGSASGVDRRLGGPR